MELYGVVWQRPWGGLALLLPALVWLLARRRGRSQEVWTGTVEVWREVASARVTQARRARSLPPAVRLLIAALGAGALALAGPRAPGTDRQRSWTAVVDRSPSMYLPWRARAGGPQPPGTRLEHAVQLAGQLLDEVRASGDRMVWLSYIDGSPVRVESAAFPGEWLDAPQVPQAEPPWSSHDQAGTLWLSDAEPSIPAREAGLALSGGSAVPGPVAALGTTRVEWDGEALSERADGGPRPVTFLGPGLEGPVERVVRAWALARGCQVSARAADRVCLEIVQASDPLAGSGGRALPAVAGRDGWTWSVELVEGLRPPGEVWLREPQGGLPIVAVQPGRITLAAGRLDQEPGGDAVDFALSWSDLLDRAVLPPAGVVSLGERRDAGAGRSRAPTVGAAPGQPAALLEVEALLVLASAGLTLGALALRRR